MSAARYAHATRSSAGTFFQCSNAFAAPSTAWFAISTVAFWKTPITSFGFEGFVDLILSVVTRFCPAITSGYSRPNMDFTWRSASSIALRFSGLEKSVNGSFTNSPREWMRSAADLVAVLVVAEAVIVGSPRCVNPNCSVRGEWRQDAEGVKGEARISGAHPVIFS